ncbi:hypothetical protein AK812_SmicGene34960 [Symbiodinium microadriaticum]|uniref:Uncharacterized protein n=1 Tax=Symbiodinium microadriaticum TaxID=2951 RepID=A0A1Q9CMP8_SYMMI|nr:hypothetical protein AK812_SmicGene34960 [Symbiodinium microadriaticum]
MFNDLQKLDDLVNLFHHDVQVPFAAITIQNCCVAGIQNLREHERARTENHRLRERVKQLNMIQKNLLKQVSVLLTEREELKRLVEKRPSSRRGRAVSSTSSCVSLHVGDLASAIRNGTKSAELSLSDSHLAQESGDDGLQEVPETARSRPHEESPERSVSRDSGLRWQCSSQELLRQIRLAGYPAARAAIASQKVNGSRGRRTSQGNGRSNPASPLRAKAEEEDFMTSYARHIKAYNLRQNVEKWAIFVQPNEYAMNAFLEIGEKLG